jgi:hypothetical protein
VLGPQPPAEAQRCLLAAMVVCLADEAALAASADCRECVELHQQQQASRAAGEASEAAARACEPQDGFATHPAAAPEAGGGQPGPGLGLAVDVAGALRAKQHLAAVAVRAVQGLLGGGETKRAREARKQLRQMLQEARQQLKAQLKAARGKSAAQKLGPDCAGGLAAYLGSQVALLEGWCAALGSGKHGVAGDEGEGEGDKRKKQKRAAAAGGGGE